jgi:hypothetical protein
MRRTLVLTTVLLGACALPGAALAQVQAQPSNGAGLRYLSWPGKAAVATPRPAPAVAAAATPAPIPARASAPIPLARLEPAPVPTPSSRGLTPASTWLGSSRPAAAAPAPEPRPAVMEHPAPQPAPQPAPRPISQPAQIVEAAPPPAAPAPAPQPAETPAADPMAPRRDAPIFRLQRPDGSVAAAPQAGTASSARYYSVHRQAGHEPDAIARPATVYLDALPVQLAQTPNSTDLAQPDGPPTLLRGANGKVRALPQTEADELP